MRQIKFFLNSASGLRVSRLKNDESRPFPGGFAIDRPNLELARVEFDDQVRFHDDRVRHVGQGRNAGEGRDHLVVVDFDVVRNVTLGELDRFENR